MNEAAIDDIARLRSIAEEGRVQPLMGGRETILWGSLVIVALLLQWAITARALPLPPMAIAAVWFGVMLIGTIASRLPAIRGGGSAPANDLGNRIEGAGWSMGGSFLAVLGICVFALSLYHLQTAGDPQFFLLFTLMPPAAFGVYGIALRATSEAAAMPALKPYAGLSLVMVAATVLLAGTMWQFPVAAAGIFLVAILPGRIMLARAVDGRHG